jgi:hypothetical protein
VPEPAETFGARRPAAVHVLRPRAWSGDVAVRDERGTREGDAHLPAVRVPGEDDVGVQVGECVEHAPVRRVRHADREGGVACDVGRADRVARGDAAGRRRIVPAAVRVAHAEGIEAQTTGLDDGCRVVQIDPAEVVP